MGHSLALLEVIFIGMESLPDSSIHLLTCVFSIQSLLGKTLGM